MAKLLRCRDVGADCDFEVRAETEEEVLQAAAKHAQSEHGMEVTDQLVAAVKGAIKEQ